jgi:hypothetical protein
MTTLYAASVIQMPFCEASRIRSPVMMFRVRRCRG